jgi:hypothetical protein
MSKSTDRSLKAINEYFGTSHTTDTATLIELMRLVSRIQHDHGFIVQIQDLNRLDSKYGSDFRIWFNRKEDMLECGFGQICQGSAPGYLDDENLETCLIYSIGEWCTYHKYLDAFSWKRVRGFDSVKEEGYLTVAGKELLVIRFHDMDHFYLEYVELTGDTIMVEMPDSYLKSEVLDRGHYKILEHIKPIVDNLAKYALDCEDREKKIIPISRK